MRTIILALAVLAGTSLAAQAEGHWKAPGWYQIADTNLGPFIYAGPFGDETACNVSLPRDNKDTRFGCKQLEERPDWDV